MDELTKMFMALDKSNDGFLTADEIKEGLVSVMGNFKGNLRKFDEIMATLIEDSQWCHNFFKIHHSCHE